MSNFSTSNSVWFSRHLSIPPADAAQDSVLFKYIDSLNDPNDLLSQLKKKMRTSFSSVFDYTVSFIAGIGIDRKNHGAYLDEMVSDFLKVCKAAIDKTASSFSANQKDGILMEVYQHIYFAKERCKLFHAKANALTQIISYLSSSADSIFVLHGSSGAGKTTIMSKAFEVASLVHPDAVFLVRFVGITPYSISSRSVLLSLCQQLCRLFKEDVAAIPRYYPDLIKYFYRSITAMSRIKRVIVFLDSLDQLEPTDDG